MSLQSSTRPGARLSRLVAPLLTALAIALAIGGGGASHARAGDSVPFIAGFSAIETVVVDPVRCPGGLTVAISGTGIGTQLGRFADEQSHCINPAVPAFTDGEFTFTAANGDTVVGTYEGVVVPQSNTTLALVGHFTITGGTGRFDGAIGAGTATGVIDLAAGRAQVLLSGDISNPGASKP